MELLLQMGEAKQEQLGAFFLWSILEPEKFLSFSVNQTEFSRIDNTWLLFLGKGLISSFDWKPTLSSCFLMKQINWKYISVCRDNWNKDHCSTVQSQTSLSVNVDNFALTVLH